MQYCPNAAPLLLDNSNRPKLRVQKQDRLSDDDTFGATDSKHRLLLMLVMQHGQHMQPQLPISSTPKDEE